MPQGRRKDFSGKKKKTQLQLKRHRKEAEASEEHPRRETIRGATVSPEEIVVGGAIEAGALPDRMVELVEAVPLPAAGGGGRRGGGRDRFDLRFRQDTREELAKRRNEARQPVQVPGGKSTLSELGEFHPEGMDFPTRPPWSPDQSKTGLEVAEARYFREYVDDLLKKYGDKLGHFELNLETWRQLWRVTEMSDILLAVVDARYPTAALPPALHQHVASREKDLLVVLNKVDLIPPGLAVAWRDCLERTFPGTTVAFFSSCPSYNLRAALGDEEAGLKYRRLRGRISMVVEGALGIFEACKGVVERAKCSVDLDSWEKVIRAALERRESGREAEGSQVVNDLANLGNPAPSDSVGGSATGRFRNNVLTIGMVGQPNAGKSSLINSLVGRRVVSVSKTPGHTKHFQTIFITPSVRLCDCPGLVFPSTAPKSLQVLAGSFPIAQVREPFFVIRFLLERVDLPGLMRLQHPVGGESWSATDVCEAWAIRRGYVSARSNRPDISRAANHLMRMALEGRITLMLQPPNYAAEEDAWKTHHDTEVIGKLLHATKVPASASSDVDEADSSDEQVSTEEEGVHGNAAPPILTNKFSALLMDENDQNG